MNERQSAREKPQMSISVGNYLDIVRRRLWVAVNTFVVSATIGIFATYLAPNVYRVTTRVLLNQQTREGNTSGLFSVAPPTPIETQAQLLQNPSLLSSVLADLKLSSDQIIGRLIVNRMENTNLVDLSLEGRDPKVLADIVNRLADRHLEWQRGDMTNEINKALVYLKVESDNAKKELAVAQRKLADYRRAHPEAADAVTPSEAGTARSDARARLRASDLTITRLKARITQGQKRLKSMPETVTRIVAEPNRALEDAQSALDKLKVERARLLRAYSSAMPQVKALDAQIAEQEDAVRAIPKTLKREVYEPNMDRRSLADSVAQWQDQLAETEDARVLLAEDVRRLSATDSPGSDTTMDSEYLERLRQQQAAAQRYATFYDRLEELNILMRSEPSVGSIVEKAIPPEEPVRPQRPFLIAAAIMAALVLSLSIVFLLEYFDDSLKWPEELEWYTGLSILGYNPTIEDKNARLITGAPVYALTTERYRVIRSNIQFATMDDPVRSLLVTSALGGEGKTLTAANLAVVFALEGRRVVLVDADMRKASQHAMFDVPVSPGLADLLDGTGSLRECLRETGTPNLYVLPAGEPSGNPAEIAGSSLMDALLEELSAHCDMVIVDSPPCLAVADAPLLATKTDATLLVVDFSRAKRHTVRQAAGVLARARARIVGVVLNRADGIRRTAYYGYYYPYTPYALPEGSKASTGSNGSVKGTPGGEGSHAPDLSAPAGNPPDHSA